MRNSIFFSALILLYAGRIMAGSTAPEPNPSPFRSSACHSDFGSYPVSDGSSADVVRGFITGQIANLQNKQTPLQLTFTNTSPGGYHYTFCQTYAGIPIFTAEVTVNVSRKNRVYSIFDDSYDISRWNVDLTGFDYQQVPAYRSFIQQYSLKQATQTASEVIAYDASTNTPQLAYLVNVNDGKGHVRDAVVSRDKVLYQHDALMYYHHAAAMPPDSTIIVTVNNPDPLTTAHVVYYAHIWGQDSAYQNFLSADQVLDSCTVQLDTQRVRKTIIGDFSGGAFYLNSHYINLANPDGLGLTPPVSTSPLFDLYRCDSGFTDIMAFYHLNTIRSYVNSLGFNSTDTPIIADPHYWTQDESFFSPQTNMVCYGTGGVPDAEDADVMVHEYTHFISWNSNHSNGSGASSERNSVDEGSADYDAASYSASIDTFHWYWVFNWDGHNEYWPGRLVNNMTVYPALNNDPGVAGSIYADAEIWSSSLMQINRTIGRGPADSLFFECLYGLAANIRLPDAAQQYIKADSLFFDGFYHCTIVNIFNQHGLAYDTLCGVYPNGIASISTPEHHTSLIAYPDGFTIVPAQSGEIMTIDLYDISGRKLASYGNVTSEIKPELPDGIYIIDVSSGGMHQGFKWALVK